TRPGTIGCLARSSAIYLPSNSNSTLRHTPFKGPAAEAPEDRIPKPEWVGKIAPGCTRAGDPEHGFEEAPVVGRRWSWVPGLAGRRGAIRSHCESFNTLRIKADLHFSALNQISQQRGIPLKQKYVHRP